MLSVVSTSICDDVKSSKKLESFSLSARQKNVVLIGLQKKKDARLHSCGQDALKVLHLHKAMHVSLY